MIALCLLLTVGAGVSFYVQFLIAICWERWHASICFLVRLECAEDEIPVFGERQECHRRTRCMNCEICRFVRTIIGGGSIRCHSWMYLPNS